MSQHNGTGTIPAPRDLKGRNRPGAALLVAQPDVRAALDEAIEYSAKQGTALSVGVNKAISASTAGAKTANNTQVTSPLPPWNHLPSEMLETIRQIDIMAVLDPLSVRMRAVEEQIEHLISAPVKLVADVAAHVMGAGGKRLRPALTLLAGELCGDSPLEPSKRALTCAALVELTHTTTLLHDDVVDAATMRRGRTAANLVWGNETSVLVGDYLFAQVFVTASQVGLADLMHPLAQATAQMCAGELLETQMRGHFEMTEKQYLEIVALKTGSLTECACRMGALAVEGTPEQVEALGTFGRSIGIAFQIVDDVFDVVSTSEELGKPVGHDIREGAITLPMLRACQESPHREEFSKILGQDHKSDADVARCLDIMRQSGSVAYCMALAQDYAALAKAQLELFPDSQARAMLCDIADYVLSREK